MRTQLLATAIAGAMLASACAPAVRTPGGIAVPSAPAAGMLGSELYANGATVRAELPNGEVNTLTFRRDGIVRNLVHSNNQVAQGRWWVANNQLCINWAGDAGPMCWPYISALRAGQTVTLTNDRGQTSRVTLLSGAR